MTSTVNHAIGNARQAFNQMATPFRALLTSTKNSFSTAKPFGQWEQTTHDNRLQYIFSESLLLSAKLVVVAGVFSGASLLLGISKVAIFTFVSGAGLYTLSQKNELLEKAANRCKELWKSAVEKKNVNYEEDGHNIDVVCVEPHNVNEGEQPNGDGRADVIVE